MYFKARVRNIIHIKPIMYMTHCTLLNLKFAVEFSASRILWIFARVKSTQKSGKSSILLEAFDNFRFICMAFVVVVARFSF